MDPLSIVVMVAVGAAAAAAAAGGYVLTARAARERMAQWRSWAAEAGVTDLADRGDGALVGSAGPFRVQLSEYSEEETRGTRVEIWSPRLATGLRLGPEGPAAVLFRSRKEIEIGDDAFDAEVSVQGPPALALALLDAATRHSLSALVNGQLLVPGHPALWASGRLDEGVLRVEVPPRSKAARSRAFDANRGEAEPAGRYYLDGEHKLPKVLRAALELAARLSRPEDLPKHLAERIPTEPEARVRLKLLLTLLREFPEEAAARRAALAARDDPDAEVRLRAGIALGPEGRDVLVGVASGEGAEDATTARAVAALGDSLTLAQATEFLKKALRTQRDATARTCLAALGRQGGPEAIQTLKQVLAVESGTRRSAGRPLAIDAAAALADTGDPSVEPALLAALRSPTTLVAIAAAQALGHVGTVAAVVPLREAEARDASLRSPARQAVAEIQARLGGAAPGQLSLSEGESGQLSIAEDDEAGRLSLAEPQRSEGRLKTAQ
jgi:HEAT repeat protein